MRAPHLLGDAWEASRWYPTPADRDAAYLRLQRGDAYYRPGDRQSLTLEKIER